MSGRLSSGGFTAADLVAEVELYNESGRPVVVQTEDGERLEIVDIFRSSQRGEVVIEARPAGGY
jgi:hypothetical protein